MKTILYINGEYCYSLEQLKSYFAKTLNPGSPLYEELLSLHLDGVLAQWLSEGNTPEEHELSNALNDLPYEDNNDKLMAELVKLFGSQGRIKERQLSDYLELLSVQCHYAGKEVILIEQNNVFNGSIDLLDDTKPEAHVTVTARFKVKKVDNFPVKVSLDDGRHPISNVIAMSGKKVNQTFDVNESFDLVLPNSDIRLFVADKEWIRVSISLDNGAKPFRVGNTEFTMIRVKGGKFMMGGATYEDEKPVHQVTLSSYYIGKHQVTQALWQAVMGTNPSNFKGDSRRPVENVSWNDCQVFISKLNQITGEKFRLPTEAEWEFAARGGIKSEGHKYAGSGKCSEVAWFSDSETHPVGKKKGNELGLYDMSGNVWEWCQDYYGSYSKASQINPTGPSLGSIRVCRGGSWSSAAEYCCVTYRGDWCPSNSLDDLGLRLAL